MPSPKSLLIGVAIAMLAIAITFRVEAVRKVVVG